MTRRPAAGERTVNGIRTFVVRAVSGEWRAIGGAPRVPGGRSRVRGGGAPRRRREPSSPRPTTWQTRASPLPSFSSRASANSSTTSTEPAASRSRRRARSSRSAGSTGPCVHSSAGSPRSSSRRQVPMAPSRARPRSPPRTAPARVRSRRPADTAYGSTVRTAPRGGRADDAGDAVGREHRRQRPPRGRARPRRAVAAGRRLATSLGRRRGRAARGRAARCRAGRSAAGARGRAAGRGRGRSRGARARWGRRATTTSSISLRRCPCAPGDLGRPVADDLVVGGAVPAEQRVARLGQRGPEAHDETGLLLGLAHRRDRPVLAGVELALGPRPVVVARAVDEGDLERAVDAGATGAVPAAGILTSAQPVRAAERRVTAGGPCGAAWRASR